jgi:hypothetical protein
MVYILHILPENEHGIVFSSFFSFGRITPFSNLYLLINFIKSLLPASNSQAVRAEVHKCGRTVALKNTESPEKQKCDKATFEIT